MLDVAVVDQEEEFEPTSARHWEPRGMAARLGRKDVGEIVELQIPESLEQKSSSAYLDL